MELGISHGTKPDDDSYAYTLLMDTSPEELDAYVENPTLHILANTDEIQAVWDESSQVFMAVFWSGGSIRIHDGSLLSVSSDCAIAVEKTDQGYMIYASNPKQNGGKLRISIGDLEGHIEFEKGMYAGQTQTLRFGLE